MKKRGKLKDCLSCVMLAVTRHTNTVNMSDKRRFSDMDQKSSGPSPDNPPFSRLFVICSKAITEECIREEFGKFGQLEEVWVVRDRVTGEHKGVVYVKYSLTSEAACALEEMSGKVLPGGGRAIKVLVAHSRGEGSKKEPFEEERALRLFVVCKKNVTEQDLEGHFKQFGRIDSIKLVKNRDSNENKGFAYIKYYRMTHAARAYENCDRSYRPKFAEPKPQVPRFPSYEGFEQNGFDDRTRAYPFRMGPTGKNTINTPIIGSFSNETFTKLQILVNPLVTQEQLWRLCDIAPGLEFCRLNPDFKSKTANDRFIATVMYSTPAQAAYARDKLNNMEYPPGWPLTVRPDPTEPAPSPLIPPFPMPNNNASLSKSDIEMLAENVKQATALLKASTGLRGMSPFESSYCSAKLPEPRSFDEEEPSNEESEARVFVVFNPNVPERPAIKDVFGRFGRILDLFLLPSKNVGYITYAKKESVKEAIAALHYQELCGTFMKVMEAEPRRSSGPDEDRRKRIRMGGDE